MGQVTGLFIGFGLAVVVLALVKTYIFGFWTSMENEWSGLPCFSLMFVIQMLAWKRKVKVLHKTLRSLVFCEHDCIVV